MKKQMLYGDLAAYYDLIYDWKAYSREAATVKKCIARFKRSSGKTLLDVACGTGQHIGYLKDDFICTGIDCNPAMLTIARTRHPRTRFILGDMTHLTLGKTFDVITCLFSSIGYVKTEAKLRKTLNGFAEHLSPGGVLIIEGWFEPTAYKEENLSLNVHDGTDVKVVRMIQGKRKGNRSVTDMHYIIGERGRSIRHVVDRHDMGLFTAKQFTELMKEVGLEPTVIPHGMTKMRNLYIGTK